VSEANEPRERSARGEAARERAPACALWASARSRR